MNHWVRFSDRLPTRHDADAAGEVDLAERNGSHRRGMWDWIPPSRPDAVDLWHVNGFVAWRRLISR